MYLSSSLPKIVIMAEELDCVGGVQKFIDQLGRGLSQRGYLIELVGLQESDAKVYYDRTSIHGVTYLKPAMGKIREAISSSTATESEKIAAGRESADRTAAGHSLLSSYVDSLESSTIIIATQVGPLSALYSLGIQGPGLPKVIAQYHGSYEYATQQHYFESLLRLFPMVSQSLFLTASDLNSFWQAGISNSRVMPNFYTRPPGANPHAVEREKTVVSLSRYAPEKSLHKLVEAWAVVCGAYPDWRLCLYGGGPEESRIRTLIEELGISGSVSLEGSVPDSAPVLQTASIHAMTSRQEGFPMSLIEASAMKVPSVAFSAGPSTAKLIDHGKSGFIVDSPSTTEFADSLAALMSDDDLRTSFGDQAFNLSKQFQAHAVLDSWEELFQSIST